MAAEEMPGEMQIQAADPPDIAGQDTPILTEEVLLENLRGFRQAKPQVGIQLMVALHKNIDQSRQQMEYGVEHTAKEWVDKILKN